MSTTRHGRSNIVTRWEISTFVSVALVALYVLPKYLKIILAIILLTDTLLLPTPFLHLLWVRIIQPATSLLWQGIHTILGLIFILITNTTDWMTRNTQAGNVALKAAGKVTDATSHRNPQLSNFFARHPIWSRIIYQWMPLLGCLFAACALYFVCVGGYTMWGFIIGLSILTFAFSPVTPLYYGMKSTYRGYLSRLSDWREIMPDPDRRTTLQKPIKSIWSRIFDSEIPKVSKVDHVVEYDQGGHSRVIEPLSRPSLIEVFLPLNPLPAASATARPYEELTPREKVVAIMSRIRAASHTFLYTMPYPEEEVAKKTRSMPTQGAIQTSDSVLTPGAIRASGSWWKFWDSEAPPVSGNLPSEEGKTNKATSEIRKGVDTADSVVRKAHKTSKSFANDALTAASTQESKIVESVLSITELTESQSNTVAKTSSIVEDKASISAEKLSMSEARTRSESSKAAEKTFSAEADVKSKASSNEASRIASATDRAKILKSQEVERIEEARKALKSKIVETSSPSAEDDAEVEGWRYTSDGRVVEESSTFIRQKPKATSKILSAHQKSSIERAAHSVADKIVDRVSKVTKVVSAQVTDYRYPADGTEGLNFNAGEGLSFRDSYVTRFVNALSTIAVTSTLSTLSFFSKLIPTTIGRAAIPLDGYPSEPSPEATGYCTYCSQTISAYLFVLGCCVFAAPYVRCLIFRTRQKLPGPIAALIAILLWIPSKITFITGLAYHNHSRLENILGTFRGNLYLLAFTLLASAKIGRTLVNSFSYNFLSHSKPPTSSHIPPWHVTVILPYTHRTSEPGKVFERCIESILVNNVYNVVLLVKDVETRFAAEQFAMNYSTDFTITIFMSVSSDRRTAFIECCRHTRSPITIFVEKGTVVWSSTFLRAALAPFDDLRTALVASAFYAYSLPAKDKELIAIDPDELLTPPSTPDLTNPSLLTTPMDSKPDPPKRHTLTQTFLLHLAKLHISRYNFSNLATHNLDGFTSPLSHQTLLIRTSILHTASFQQFFFNHRDPVASLTQWVQSAGLRTVFLTSHIPQVHLYIPTPQATKSLISYIRTTVLKMRRKEVRHALNSLFFTSTTYKSYPWSTFASHIFKLVDIPLVYDTFLFYTLIYGMDAGKGRVCQLLVTLLILRVLERPGMVWKGFGWLSFNGEFWAWFFPVLGWEYVVESLVGVWAVVSCWV